MWSFSASRSQHWLGVSHRLERHPLLVLLRSAGGEPTSWMQVNRMSAIDASQPNERPPLCIHRALVSAWGFRSRETCENSSASAAFARSSASCTAPLKHVVFFSALRRQHWLDASQPNERHPLCIHRALVPAWGFISRETHAKIQAHRNARKIWICMH